MTEAELLDLLMGLMPEDWEGWLAAGFGLCAILSLIIPAPAKNAHPVLKCGHRTLCILGLGAGRLKAAGRLGKIGRLAMLFRRQK